ncbi:class I SAM-dependent methyltransferase [Nonomuraea sp. NPDC001831]|uniref:class I SAM-dependent methyltransferase n=1 Tax=Nonomuraea sp. NPDC001831 TaxID=3364340 RepID=UPI00368C941A
MAAGRRLRGGASGPRAAARGAGGDGAGAARPGRDARRLPVPDGGADAVLLLGPLYNLADRADRLRALGEARRAVRPGGVVAAATINRYAAVLDTVNLGTYLEERQREAARAAAADGVMLSPRRGFTAYFHHPDEVAAEFAEAGLTVAHRPG